MAAHFKNKNRNGQNKSYNQRAAKFMRLDSLSVDLFMIIDRLCTITGFLDSFFQRINCRHIFEHLDMGAVCRQIDSSSLHPTYREKCLFDAPHTRSATHPINIKVNRLVTHFITGFLDRLHKLVDTEFIPACNVSFFCCQIDDSIVYAFNFF